MMKNILLYFIAMFLFFSNGCSDNHTHDHGDGEHSHEHGNGDSHGHDDEHSDDGLKPLSFTKYAKHSELFVEFQSLVVGKRSKFAAHVTILGENFKPLTNGKMTVILSENGSDIENAPSSPGIFRPELIPSNPGTGLNLTFIIDTKEFTDTIVIQNITVYPDKESVKAEVEKDDHSHDVTYLKEQAWKVEFANEEVLRKDFYYTIKTTGQILTPPSDEAIISAKSSGIVNFNSNYILGMKVSGGENLFNISGSNLNQENINTKIFEAKSNLDKAKIEYERGVELNKDKIISDKDLLTLKNNYEINNEVYNSLSSNYTGSAVKVFTPISGNLKSLNVRQGEFVQAGQTLAIVSKNNKLLLKADLSQKYFNVINKISSANFKTPDGNLFNTLDLNGKAIVFSKNTGPDNLLLPVNIEIDFREDLIPGTFVEVFLKTERIPNVLVIPVTSLIEEQGKFYVYIQTGGESFQKRFVNIGESDGLNVQVNSGIAEGERLVTKGGYQIKVASLSGSIPSHGHEH